MDTSIQSAYNHLHAFWPGHHTPTEWPGFEAALKTTQLHPMPWQGCHLLGQGAVQPGPERLQGVTYKLTKGATLWLVPEHIQIVIYLITSLKDESWFNALGQKLNWNFIILIQAWKKKRYLNWQKHLKRCCFKRSQEERSAWRGGVNYMLTSECDSQVWLAFWGG